MKPSKTKTASLCFVSIGIISSLLLALTDTAFVKGSSGFVLTLINTTLFIVIVRHFPEE